MLPVRSRCLDGLRAQVRPDDGGSVMKAKSHPLKDLFAEPAGAAMVGMRTTALGEPKPFDLLMAYVVRAAMGLIVLGAVTGAAHQIGQMARPDRMCRSRLIR